MQSTCLHVMENGIYLQFLFSGLVTSCMGIILFCPFTAILFDTVREHSIFFLFSQRFQGTLLVYLGFFCKS